MADLTGIAYGSFRCTGKLRAKILSESNNAFIRFSNEGEMIGLVGDVYRILARGADTGGKYAMLEAVVPPGGGPPPHVHRREDESFWVLEGEITFSSEGTEWVATAGCFVSMPIGTPHAFKNKTDRPAKMLITLVPAGLEQYFAEVGCPYDGSPPALPTEQEIRLLREAAPKYGIEFVGDDPGASH